MPRVSCITPPAEDRFLTIHQWHIDFCQGNHCAASVLSVLINFHDFVSRKGQHNRRMNQVASDHGEEGMQDESLFQFHTVAQLEERIMGAYKRTAIKSAIKLLEGLGAISLHRNPNPRYKFDKTTHFLLTPKVCQKWLNDRQFAANRLAENDQSENEGSFFDESGYGQEENNQAARPHSDRLAENGQSKVGNDPSNSRKRPIDESETDLRLAGNGQAIEKTNIQNNNKKNNNIIFKINAHGKPPSDEVKQILVESFGCLRAAGIPDEVLLTQQVTQEIQGWVEQGMDLLGLRNVLGQLAQHGQIRWGAVRELIHRSFETSVLSSPVSQTPQPKGTRKSTNPLLQPQSRERSYHAAEAQSCSTNMPDWLKESK